MNRIDLNRKGENVLETCMRAQLMSLLPSSIGGWREEHSSLGAREELGVLSSQSSKAGPRPIARPESPCLGAQASCPRLSLPSP